MDGSTVIFLMGVFPLVAVVIIFRNGDQIRAKFESWIKRVDAPDEHMGDVDEADDFPPLDTDQQFRRNKPPRSFSGDRSLPSSRK